MKDFAAAPTGGRPLIIEAKALVRLAGPIVATQLGQMCIGTTDVLMIGRLDKDALAAAALGWSLYFAAFMFGLGSAMAVAPMIAHRLGEGRRGDEGVRVCVRMALWGMLALTPGLSVFLYFAGDLLAALGEPAELAVAAGGFVRILCFGLPAALAFHVLRGYATALGRPTTALVVTGLTIVINGVADFALIFGHFGMKRLGLEGAAIASAASLNISFIAIVAATLLVPALRRYRPFHRFFEVDWPTFVELFKLGVPIGLAMLVEMAFFSGSSLIMGYFGAPAVAAHQIALNVASIAFMVPLGIGTAASVRVGLAAGAGNGTGVRSAGGMALALSASVMTSFGIVLALFPRHIAGLYVDVDNPANVLVTTDAIIFLRFAAAFQLFDSVQVTASHALRGLKDTSGPMLIAGICYGAIGLPCAVWLSFAEQWRGAGVWGAFCLGLVLAAVTLTWRFVHKSNEFS
jgi:MATE family multidrug resistance protein